MNQRQLTLPNDQLLQLRPAIMIIVSKMYEIDSAVDNYNFSTIRSKMIGWYMSEKTFLIPQPSSVLPTNSGIYVFPLIRSSVIFRISHILEVKRVRIKLDLVGA